MSIVGTPFGDYYLITHTLEEPDPLDVSGTYSYRISLKSLSPLHGGWRFDGYGFDTIDDVLEAMHHRENTVANLVLSCSDEDTLREELRIEGRYYERVR